jgi:hypothetical protein
MIPPPGFLLHDSSSSIPPPGCLLQDSCSRIPPLGLPVWDSSSWIPPPAFLPQHSSSRMPPPPPPPPPPPLDVSSRIPPPGFLLQDSSSRIPGGCELFFHCVGLLSRVLHVYIYIYICIVYELHINHLGLHLRNCHSLKTEMGGPVKACCGHLAGAAWWRL